MEEASAIDDLFLFAITFADLAVQHPPPSGTVLGVVGALVLCALFIALGESVLGSASNSTIY